MYFVVCQNVGTDPERFGQKHIFYHGIAHPYGEYYEEYGFPIRHKAEVEIMQLKRFFKENQSEKLVFYVEDKTIIQRKETPCP